MCKFKPTCSINIEPLITVPNQALYSILKVQRITLGQSQIMLFTLKLGHARIYSLMYRVYLLDIGHLTLGRVPAAKGSRPGAAKVCVVTVVVGHTVVEAGRSEPTLGLDINNITCFVLIVRI